MQELESTLNENKNKTGPKNDELANKVKKLQAQMTNMSKELEEEKSKNKNLEKELALESKLKNHSEVENARNLGMVTVLKDILEKGHKSSQGMEKKKVKCRDFEKFGSCKRAESCAFLHPNIVCQSYLATGCKNPNALTPTLWLEEEVPIRKSKEIVPTGWMATVDIVWRNAEGVMTQRRKDRRDRIFSQGAQGWSSP